MKVMIKNNITVADLNTAYTNKDQEYVRRIHILRKELGILPKSYDLSSKIPELNNPFSTNYETLDKYLEDRERIEKLISHGKTIPEDLYNRMKETIKELNDTYGPGILW